MKDDERYSRQRVLREIGPRGQERLAASRILIVGCGALGSVQAELLVRAGVGNICIVDRDVVEMSNLQRQTLFDEEDAVAGIPKVVAAMRRLRTINSAVQIRGIVLDVLPENVEELVSDATLVLDGTDNFETRYLINDACVKHRKPWIYGGVIGTGGMAMTVLPGRGPCLRCVFMEAPSAGSEPTCDTEGVLNTAPAAVASIQVTEALRLIVEGEIEGFRMFVADLWRGSWRSVGVVRDEVCPCCGEGRFDFLDATALSRTTLLCGRDAIQVSPPQGTRLSLPDLEKRLSRVGTVSRRDLMLQLEVEKYRLHVFPDGRAIIRGTTDEAVARSLYAKYLGS
ncbi:MAG: ThiF family adenylyltransferase [Planctomycetota bacterium]